MVGASLGLESRRPGSRVIPALGRWKYQNLWGQAAMASSIRDRIHRPLTRQSP